MENTTIQNISNKANSFIQSKWSFVVFLSGIAFFAILNYLMFALGVNDFTIDTAIWGSVHSTDANGWIGYGEITIGTLGSLLTITGVILTIRFDKRFIIPLVVGESLVILDAFILGAYFTCFSYALMIISALYNYIQWNKEGDDMAPKMDLVNWIIVGVFLVIYIGIGFGAIFGTNLYDQTEFSSYNDIFSSGIVVACWYMVLRKSKWGFIGFVITDITYLILFASAGVWVAGSSYIVYIFIDSTSFISWLGDN